MRQTETLRHGRADAKGGMKMLADVKRAAKNAPRRKTRQPAQDKNNSLAASVAAHASFIDTAWFKRILAEKRLSQRQLAFKMDMDPGAMSLMLNGKRGMSAGEAAGMAAWINVPVEEILMRAGVSTGVLNLTSARAETKAVVGRSAIKDKSEPFVVPVVGWANGLGTGNEWAQVRMGADGLLGPREVTRPNGVLAGVVALRIQGGMMDGWVVYYLPPARAVAGGAGAAGGGVGVGASGGVGLGFDVIGQLCVVGLSDGRVVLRHVRLGYGQGELVLVGMCGEPLDVEVSVEWATPVLWIKQR